MPPTEHYHTAPATGDLSNAADTSTDARVQVLLFGSKRKKPDPHQTMIHRRLPLSSIDRMYKKLRVKKSKVLDLISMSEETYRERHESHQPLSSTESDRLYRLATIEAQAADVFEDEQIAADWLKTPNRALDARPIDLLDSETGADQVERVLTRIEHGVYS